MTATTNLYSSSLGHTACCGKDDDNRQRQREKHRERQQVYIAKYF